MTQPEPTAQPRTERARVLVTGATGFLGGHCASTLSGRYHIIATGRNAATLARLKSSGVEVEPIDLTSRDATERLAAHQPDVVVHSAALSSPWGARAEFDTANITATEAVLKACVEVGARLVHLSTPTLYMDGCDRLLIDEEAPLPPSFVNDYATTKYEAEQRVLASPVPAAILRPQAIVGAGDAAVAPRFERIASRGFFPMIRGRDPLLDLTHVANVVQAIEACCDKLLAGAWTQTETFNITNGDPRLLSAIAQAFLDARVAAGHSDPVRRLRFPHRLLTIFARLAEAVAFDAREPIVTRYSVDLLATSRTLSIEKARRMLGYQPEANTIDQAFAQYFAAARSAVVAS